MKKVTEIKVTLGRDVVVMTPDACLYVVNGKSYNLDPKLAAKLFKSVADPAEKMCDALKDYRG